jgi:hypothetical protein
MFIRWGKIIFQKSFKKPTDNDTRVKLHSELKEISPNFTLSQDNSLEYKRDDEN